MHAAKLGPVRRAAHARGKKRRSSHQHAPKGVCGKLTVSLYTLASSSLVLPFLGPAPMTVTPARRRGAVLHLRARHPRAGQHKGSWLSGVPVSTGHTTTGGRTVRACAHSQVGATMGETAQAARGGLRAHVCWRRGFCCCDGGAQAKQRPRSAPHGAASPWFPPLRSANRVQTTHKRGRSESAAAVVPRHMLAYACHGGTISHTGWVLCLPVFPTSRVAVVE